MSNQDPISYLTRALAIREKMLGPEHPTTKAMRENYAYLLREMEREGNG